MKTYIASNYQDWNILSAELTADLNQSIPAKVSVTHSKYGAGTFSNPVISISSNMFNIIADFEFANETKKLALNILLTKNYLQIADTEVHKTLIDFIEQLTTLSVDINNISHDRFVEAQEAARAEAERVKQEAKRLSHREKSIQEFERMTRVDRGTCATGEFYYNLGWLAKNVGTISATLPDYLLPYFENHFGTEAKPTVVDSNKRTVNGHPMQWTFSMKASLLKNSLSTIPALLKQYLSSAGNSLTHTELIWDIVENYGFKFGKTQDVEQIRSSIRPEYIKYFENGYAA